MDSPTYPGHMPREISLLLTSQKEATSKVLVLKTAGHLGDFLVLQLEMVQSDLVMKRNSTRYQDSNFSVSFSCLK